MLTISDYASKSVFTIGFGCRRFGNFCKAGRWCRCYIVPGVHRHIHALELQLWQVPTSTQEDKEEGEEGAQSSPEEFHLAKPRIKDWKSGPRDFQLWWGWGHERRGKAVIRRTDHIMEMCKGNAMLSLNLWWCIRLKTMITTDWGAGQILAGNAVVLKIEMVNATGDPPKLW